MVYKLEYCLYTGLFEGMVWYVPGEEYPCVRTFLIARYTRGSSEDQRLADCWLTSRQV